MKSRIMFVACLLALTPLFAAESVDLTMVTRIRQEGFRNSKVMETAHQLMDRIGPRLTNSPNAREANEWTRKQLADWGLQNAHLESWGPFGRGWEYESVSVRMLAPDVAQLVALPKAWTPGTQGPVRAKVMRVKLAAEEDLEKQKGKLAGTIVLLGEMPEIKPQDKAALERYDEAGLTELSLYKPPAERQAQGGPEEFLKRREFRKKLNEFLVAEKVLATMEAGVGGDGGAFDVGSGGSYKLGESIGVPSLVLGAEHYGRIHRLLNDKLDVELELDVRTRFFDEEPMGHNTVAEIPGSDKKDEIVMIGAHLDSWHAGTGATDNGAGVVTMMEAMRILQALKIKPRRTIRIGLWTGEEQGLLGSRGYVSEHFGVFADPKDPAEKDLPSSMRKEKTPLTLKPGHGRFAAYFNMDNGTGKIRGIYTQENIAVVPIFEEWLKPFADLGAKTITARNTGGTDHLSFDAVGLPGFQFIQDDVEYRARTHHSNTDVYERLQRDDLMQAAVIIATFAYNAAMRDEPLPRKSMPDVEIIRPAAGKRK